MKFIRNILATLKEIIIDPKYPSIVLFGEIFLRVFNGFPLNIFPKIYPKVSDRNTIIKFSAKIHFQLSLIYTIKKECKKRNVYKKQNI